MLSFSLQCHYTQSAIVTTDAQSEDYVIVVEGFQRRQFCALSAPTIMVVVSWHNLGCGCAGQVGNLTIVHVLGYLILEPDKELSDRISLATLTWNCIKSARQLEECHVIIDQ